MAIYEVYFGFVWYRYIFPFWYVVQRKIWQHWSRLFPECVLVTAAGAFFDIRIADRQNVDILIVDFTMYLQYTLLLTKPNRTEPNRTCIGYHITPAGGAQPLWGAVS
jgi:hypothetical protein